jgi:dienelactone hydrolase
VSGGGSVGELAAAVAVTEDCAARVTAAICDDASVRIVGALGRSIRARRLPLLPALTSAVLLAAPLGGLGLGLGASARRTHAAAIPVCGSSPIGGQEAAAPASPPTAQGGYAVGECVLRLVDPTRRIHLPPPGNVSVPRTLLTYVRYPALGAAGAEVPGAAPARAQGPFPLVVFAHGFDISPMPYARLLDSWARAGYVVAAPVFPLTGASGAGGIRILDEADVVNEPADMSFVISQLLAVTQGQLAGLIDGARIAVAGQSDGGEAALAAAYSRRYADPRVRAAVILSGAEMSGIGGYRFPAGGPALLAAQGTADTSNEPRYTYAYFRAARRPKYLLKLLGAQHLPPYTGEQPQLSIVERVTSAFLDAYLKGNTASMQQLSTLGTVPRTAALTASP